MVNLQFGITLYTSKEYALKPGPVDLKIKGYKTIFAFSFTQGYYTFTPVESVDKFLGTETVGFFTGVYIGMYPTGNDQPATSYANFHWFEYLM